MDFGEECENLICSVAHCRKVYPEACSESLIKAKRSRLNFVKDAKIKINKKDPQDITLMDSPVDLEKCMSDALKICATSKDICKKLDEVTSSLQDITDVLKMDIKGDIPRLLQKLPQD